MRKFLLICFFLTSGFLWAEFRSLPDDTGFLYPPEGWTLYSEDSGSLSFMEDNREAVFQIMTFQKNEYDSSRDMATSLFSSLDIVSREESSFRFLGSEAILADVTFISSERENRGYFFLYSSEKFHYYLVAMAPLEYYEKQHDSLLSFLDSFSPNEEGLGLPGPISQFYEPSPSPVKSVVTIKTGSLAPLFNGDKLVSLRMGPGEGEALQVTIEREARLLVETSPEEVNLSAWLRYYQIILRESKGRLKSVHDVLSPQLQGLTDREKVETLLTWVQGYDYHREENSLSDLLSPVTAVLESRGDCDARALILLSLLGYEGIPGLLMVSSTYAHAMAAFDLEGPGARFPHETLPTGFIVAETTDQVSLGMINGSKADPAEWLGIPCPYPVSK